MKRRKFINNTTKASLALTFLGAIACKEQTKKSTEDTIKEVVKDTPLFFKLSLAQWSFHRALKAGKMDNLDFAKNAKALGCEGLEYVNQFFADKATDTAYLNEMNSRAKSEGLENVLIMIDGEGQLADADSKKRHAAIENHYKWVEAAKFLGCHAIRVNLAGGVEMEEASKAGIDSLMQLSEFASKEDVNILVENHGGFSSNGAWLANVMKNVNKNNCGTLPDFGNFCIEYDKNHNCKTEYDRYKGVKEMLPYAKAVSAKSHDFDTNGNEVHTDYLKMMQMVKASGYKGFVGIEYEGDKVSEKEGIALTRDLLIKVGKELS